MRVGRTDSFRLRRLRVMHVLEFIPDSSKKAVFGHEAYVVSTSRWIFVARHLLLFPRNPFHQRGLEVVRASGRDTEVSAFLHACHCITRRLAEINLAQQMEDSVGEEGTHSLSGSALENRGQIAGVKTGAAQQWYAACLTLLIGAACQGNSLFRDINPDDVETELRK